MDKLHLISFYVSLICVILAVLMGVASIWVPSSELGRKLFFTNLVIMAGAVVASGLTKWLN